MPSRRTSNFFTFVCGVAALINGADAGFFRMSCNAVLHGRVDPLVSPGQVAGHVHKISGGYNIGLSSTFEDMTDSRCTSCEITADKSAYWTPLLYYQHPNGTFQDVPSGGHVVYYLGRGDVSTIKPFPEGFRMLTGNSNARSYDDKTLTWNGKRPIADRVSYACLSSAGRLGQTPNLVNTNCDNGMRAQIHFQSCWDGKNLYKEDNSHVAHMGSIDNGPCPSTHPVKLPQLFFEVYYSVNRIDQKPGGRFVFANGDATGYGFHADFLNGWDSKVQADVVNRCLAGDNPSGQVSTCPPLAAVQSTTYGKNCPERPALIDEQIKGILDALPGCNPVTTGPNPASNVCPNMPTPNVNPWTPSTPSDAPSFPAAGTIDNGWKYLGSAPEPKNSRLFRGARWTSNSMTTAACQTYCDNANFVLAGLEYGRECYCSNSVDESVISKDFSTSLNSMACAGDSSDFCGGSARLMIYRNVDDN